MSGPESKPEIRFAPGDIVHHRLFGYRGVVIGVDRSFQGSEEWYRTVARSRPPRQRPWYHVLPHGSTHQTYVAERNLERDRSGQPVEHPQVRMHFTHFVGGRYIDARMN